MPRFVTMIVDIDELSRVIASSVRTCLKAHDIELPDEYVREAGNNSSAAVMAVFEKEAYEERLELWAHIVSEHCNMAAPGSLHSMLNYHEDEHRGPGTIRNHPVDSRHYSLRKLTKVLSELEPEDYYSSRP